MELTFAQNFSLIALNDQDSLRLTASKKAALRSMAVAYGGRIPIHGVKLGKYPLYKL